MELNLIEYLESKNFEIEEIAKLEEKYVKNDAFGNIKKYEYLPENTKKYIEFIEKKIERPIKIIGNGPRREDIIVCF